MDHRRCQTGHNSVKLVFTWNSRTSSFSFSFPSTAAGKRGKACFFRSVIDSDLRVWFDSQRISRWILSSCSCVKRACWDRIDRIAIEKSVCELISRDNCISRARYFVHVKRGNIIELVLWKNFTMIRKTFIFLQIISVIKIMLNIYISNIFLCN